VGPDPAALGREQNPGERSDPGPHPSGAADGKYLENEGKGPEEDKNGKMFQ